MKCLVSFFLVAQVLTGCYCNSYKAAVVDYSPFSGSSPGEILTKNAQEYLNKINDAKSLGAQIVVFPEYGLTTTAANASNEWATMVPHPNENIAPWQNRSEEYPRWFMDLSSRADSADIYLVVNLIENATIDGKKYFFNTNVAFGKDGKVIGRYRKENLFDEPTLTSGRGFNDESAYFTTDFNVKFGMIICFDILFQEPAYNRAKEVANVIMSTAWMSEVPFLSALSVQSGYARANGINLLVADYSKPKDAFGGSGIYSIDGTMETFLPLSEGAKVVVMDLPIITQPRFSVDYQSQAKSRGLGSASVDNFHSLNEDLSQYKFQNINSTNRERQTLKLCEEDICCELQVKIQSNVTGNVNYKLALHAGIRKYDVQEGYIETCGIVACESTEISSCGKRLKPTEQYGFESIQLIGEYKTKSNNFYFPTTLRLDMEPLSNDQYTYEVTTEGDKTKIKMVSDKLQTSLVTFGIYGRSSVSSVAQISVSIFSLMLTAMVMFFNR